MRARPVARPARCPYDRLRNRQSCEFRDPRSVGAEQGSFRWSRSWSGDPSRVGGALLDPGVNLDRAVLAMPADLVGPGAGALVVHLVQRGLGDAEVAGGLGVGPEAGPGGGIAHTCSFSRCGALP